MDLLDLIKRRASTRRYLKKQIPKRILDKIIEAGVWGPSIPSFLKIQPWKFVVVTKKTRIREIAKIVEKKAKQSRVGVNILLNAASRIIDGASAVILIYNSGDLKKIKSKYRELYSGFAEIIPNAELSAISAAAQNMILMAASLKIGSCWLDTPLFCQKEIAKVIKEENNLVGVLTFGYPDEKGRRSPRKPIIEMVRCFA